MRVLLEVEYRLSRSAVVALGLASLLLAPCSPAVDSLSAQDRLQVVATLPTYAAIAREITGPLADVSAIARGDEDPHFVDPRPSFARRIQAADLFISTGLDLELWVPGLLDRANNPEVREGAPGHVVAYAGIELLDVPASVSRAGGDVHIFGNPHIHTDPINGIIIGRNILAGLRRVDPGNAAAYEANAAEFENRTLRQLFGDRVYEMLGGEVLFELARTGSFWEFAETQSYQGRPLTEHVGGWLAEAAAFRGRQMACYHKNWAYFSRRFEVDCAIYVEPRPGIPPSPGQVRKVVSFLQESGVPVLLAANYFSRRQVETVAHRGFAVPLLVPEHVEGAAGVTRYSDLFDTWIPCLSDAFLGTDQGEGHCPAHHPDDHEDH